MAPGLVSCWIQVNYIHSVVRASSERAGASPGQAKRSKDVSGAQVSEGSAAGLFRGFDRGGGTTASTRAVRTTRGAAAGSGVFRRGAVDAAL